MGLGKSVTREVAVVSQDRELNLGRNGLGSVINSFGGVTVEGSLLSTPGAGAPWEISGNSYIMVYRGVLSIPGVWRAANLLSELLGGVDYDAYTTHGKDQATLLDPRPLLLEQPAPPDTNMTTFSSMALDLVLEGNAIATIAQRDGNGFPTAISPYPVAWSGIYRDPQTREVTYSIDGVKYAAEDVLHIKGPTVPGQVRGMGVIEAHLYSTIGLAAELNRQARDVGLNAVPTGVYQSGNPDLTSEEAEATKSGWLRAMRNRTIAVMGPNDKFTALAWNPTEAQLIEARQFSLVELALLFGLPPSFLNAPSGGNLTYSNVENDAINLLKFSLQGHLTRIEQAFSLCFPRGTNVKADLDGFLKSDTLTRYQAYQVAVQTGWLLRSEVRTKELMVPVASIDKDPNTAGTQMKLDKTEPVNQPGLTQVKEPASGPFGGPPPGPPAPGVPAAQPSFGGTAQ